MPEKVKWWPIHRPADPECTWEHSGMSRSHRTWWFGNNCESKTFGHLLEIGSSSRRTWQRQFAICSRLSVQQLKLDKWFYALHLQFLPLAVDWCHWRFESVSSFIFDDAIELAGYQIIWIAKKRLMPSKNNRNILISLSIQFTAEVIHCEESKIANH